MDILHKIANERKLDIERLKVSLPLESFKGDLGALPGARFRQSLERDSGPHIIAEIKKASPSRGVLVDDFDPVFLAKEYRDGGAAALSVLTESRHFQGQFEYMAETKEASGLPVLCKDFVIDPYQIYHAKMMLADAVLLIVALQGKETLQEMLGHAEQARVDALVEVHDEDELEIALSAGAEVIGVNNRNLQDFTVSLETSEKLGPMIPDSCVKVAESGIFERQHVERLQEAGFDAFLIGEALVTSRDPATLMRSLRGA